MNKLNKLLRESTQSAASDQGRPALIGLTKAVNTLIYKDLVAVQESKLPQSTVFGVRYLNKKGDMSFVAPSVYGGAVYNTTELKDGHTSFNKGDYFEYDKAVYQALDNIDISTLGGKDLRQNLFLAVMKLKARIVTEGSTTANGEYQDIAPVQLKIDRWQVDSRTRKLKSELTHELLDDLRANGFDSDTVIENMLSSEVAEEVNKDIIKTLQTVSLRHNSVLVNNGVADLTTAGEDPSLGRTVYRIVSEMAAAIQRDTSYAATYVMCSPGVAALLDASGWMKKDPTVETLSDGYLRNGMAVYIDSTTQFDYVLVGMKHEVTYDVDVSDRTFERVGSLFYSPYVDNDGAGVFVITNSAEDLQPRVMTMVRYGLSVNPYTISEADETSKERKVYKGDDWINLAGRSKYSRFAGIFLQ